MNYLLDTNAILYALKGKAEDLPFIVGDRIYISFITRIELLSCKMKPEEEALIENLISNYELVLIDDRLVASTIDIRKQHRLKLPDSIIMGTAIQKQATLITADIQMLKETSVLGIQTINPLKKA